MAFPIYLSSFFIHIQLLLPSSLSPFFFLEFPSSSSMTSPTAKPFNLSVRLSVYLSTYLSYIYYQLSNTCMIFLHVYIHTHTDSICEFV